MPVPTSNKHVRGSWIRWLILPLLLGASTALLITRTEKQETEITITPTFNNLADDLLLIDDQGPSVRLLVSGTTSALETIDSAEITYRMDLSDLREGEHTILVHKEDIRLPQGVVLLSVLTPSITIRLEAVSLKTVDVVAVLEGITAPGFTVAAVTLKPDHIVLKGATSMLAGIDTVKTRPINLEVASGSFKKEVPLNLPEAITVDSPLRIVVADIEVKERIIKRVLENITVSGKGAATGFQISPPALSLTVSGPETIVNAIETNPSFDVAINISGLSPGIHSLKAAIHLPVRTALIRVSPERFSVTISK